MRASLIVILVVGVCLAVTLAQKLKNAKKEKTKKIRENGRMVRYCLYKDIKILPGGIFQDIANCRQCKCKKKALVCHRNKAKRGIRADYGKNCKPIKAGCNRLWVDKDDNSKVCKRI